MVMEEEGDKEEDEDIPFESVDEISFEVEGKSLAEALKKAVLEMSGIVADLEDVNPSSKRELNLDAKKEDTLAGDFLEHLLFLIDNEGFLPCGVEELTIEGNVLHCILWGCSMEELDIKGTIISLLDANLEVKKGSCKLRVTLEKGSY